MNKAAVLRAVLALVCISHLVLGAIGFVSVPEPVAKAISAVYGATVTITPELQHVIRILGAFMLAIGVMAAFAFMNPQENRAIITGVAVLLLLRVAQRIFFASEIHEVFAVAYGRLWTQSLFFLALAAALLILRPRAEHA